MSAWYLGKSHCRFACVVTGIAALRAWTHPDRDGTASAVHRNNVLGNHHDVFPLNYSVVLGQSNSCPFDAGCTWTRLTADVILGKDFQEDFADRPDRLQVRGLTELYPSCQFCMSPGFSLQKLGIRSFCQSLFPR